MQLTNGRVHRALEKLDDLPPPRPSSVEAVNGHLILYHGVSPYALPVDIRKLLAKAAEQLVKADWIER